MFQAGLALPLAPRCLIPEPLLLRHWRFDRVPQRYSRVDATAQSCVFCDLTTYYKLKLVSIIMYQSTAKCKSVDCCMIFK